MDIRKVRDELHKGRSIYSLPMRVTFYARVSTDKYEQASSLEHQIQYYTDFIMKNPGWTYVEGYIDEGASGTSTKGRNSFLRMIEDARAGQFDFIITKEISRFSRSTLDSIQFTQELLRLGVGVLFQNDGINTLDSDSEFRLVVMAGVAQDEVRKLSERLKFGFKQSIKNGRVLGSDSLYGYDKADCRLTINEREAEIVRLIFDLYVNRRMGMRRISFYLYEKKGITSSRGNPFNVTTIKNMILNPKYKGFYCGNRTKSIDYRLHKSIKLDPSEWVTYRDDSIPAIVSEAIWDKANELLKSRGEHLRESGAEYNNMYPYSGKLVCAEHGTSLHRNILKSAKGDIEIWQCKVYRQQGAKACGAPHLRTRELDAIMAHIFNGVMKDKDRLIGKILALLSSTPDERDYQSEIDHLAREMDEIRVRKDKLLDMSIVGALSNPEFKERHDRLNAEIDQLAAKQAERLAEQRKSKAVTEDLSSIRCALESELSFKEGLNSELITTILDKIIVYTTGDKAQIKLEIHLKTGEVINVEGARGNLSLRNNIS